MLTLDYLVLMIKNPKLYNSPYRTNVVKVLKVLKEYDIFCRINFYKNLSTLEIEEVDEDKLKELASLSYATYDVNDNKIYLSKEIDDISRYLNHELFRVASDRKNHCSGIIWSQYNSTKKNKAGERLNDGIIEYLTLKSLDKSISVSSYQLELFVIEFLCFVYGKEILIPYLKNDGRDFFEQFKSITFCYGKILQIEEKMNYINDNVNKKQVLSEHDLEYDNIQREYFEYILNKLIELAQLNDKNINEINDFINNSLNNKDIEFKRLYSCVINKDNKYKVKKR